MRDNGSENPVAPLPFELLAGRLPSHSRWFLGSEQAYLKISNSGICIHLRKSSLATLDSGKVEKMDAQSALAGATQSGST